MENYWYYNELENLQLPDENTQVYSIEQIEKYLQLLEFEENQISQLLKKIKNWYFSSRDMVFWSKVFSKKISYFHENNSGYEWESFKKILRMIEIIWDIIATIRQDNLKLK